MELSRFDDQRSHSRAKTTVFVEEVRAGGASVYFQTVNLSESGALLVAPAADTPEGGDAGTGRGTGADGRRFAWFRFDLPFECDYVPVLGEVVSDRSVRGLRYRHVRFKHVFPDGRGALGFHLCRARGGL